MIKQITFEEIEHYWKTYLWAKYVNEGYKINRVNTTAKEGYFYKAMDILNQNQIESVIKPTYIAYFNDDRVIGVESGYKTNTDYYRVRGLWVDEHHRRRGIATKLIQWFEERAGVKYLWTVPRGSAVGFYERYGFIVTGMSALTVYGQNYFALKEIK